jgi:GT2 family glycosyltransferase
MTGQKTPSSQMEAMRVLAHIHTLNDAEVIEQALDSLRRQTRPPDSIIIVDNASTDATLDRIFPDGLTIVRNTVNLGTSGAIRIGLAHGLAHQFDWVWLFDADSVPEPDALENLLSFFARLPASEQQQICFLACQLAIGGPGQQPMKFTQSGIEYVALDIDAGCCRCDCFIWTGSLLRVPAVAKIGLPSADYVLDIAELEYGYRAYELGFTSYVVNSGVLHQDVGRRPGVATRTKHLGPFYFTFFEVSPIRCYYHVRNMLYFWLYQCRPPRPRWIVRSIVHAIYFPRTFFVRPFSHHRQLIACLRGLWDGLTMHIERRY